MMPETKDHYGVDREALAAAIAERLRTARIHQGLSQDQLGKLSGCAQTQVSKFELAVNIMGADKAIALARPLRCSPEWLMFGVGRGPVRKQ